MKKTILTTICLLYIGLVYGQLLPNQKTELATNQKANFKYNADISSITKKGNVMTTHGQVNYSVTTNSRADYNQMINDAFEMMNGRVDLYALRITPIHFYFNSTPHPSVPIPNSSIPWAYGFNSDLINSGVVSYSRMDPYNFDNLDFRIVIQVPKSNPDREVVIGNILKGVGRILHEVSIGADTYWQYSYQSSNANVEATSTWAELSTYAGTSPRAFISEYFAIWVMRLQFEKIPDETGRSLIARFYSDFKGPLVH